MHAAGFNSLTGIIFIWTPRQKKAAKQEEVKQFQFPDGNYFYLDNLAEAEAEAARLNSFNSLTGIIFIWTQWKTWVRLALIPAVSIP